MGCNRQFASSHYVFLHNAKTPNGMEDILKRSKHLSPPNLSDVLVRQHLNNNGKSTIGTVHANIHAVKHVPIKKFTLCLTVQQLAQDFMSKPLQTVERVTWCT